MIKVILFDADGVMINKPWNMDAKLVEKYQVPMESIQQFFKEDFAPCLVGKADLKEVLVPHLSQWKWPGSVDDFLQFWFQTEHYVDGAMVAHVQQMKQRGIDCYMATNQEKYRFEYIRNEMGFDKIFKKVFASILLGYKKPHMEFFAAIMEHLPGVKKEEVLLWDDDHGNIEGAKQFGIQAEFFTSPDDFQHKMRGYLL